MRKLLLLAALLFTVNYRATEAGEKLVCPPGQHEARGKDRDERGMCVPDRPKPKPKRAVKKASSWERSVTDLGPADAYYGRCFDPCAPCSLCKDPCPEIDYELIRIALVAACPEVNYDRISALCRAACEREAPEVAYDDEFRGCPPPVVTGLTRPDVDVDLKAVAAPVSARVAGRWFVPASLVYVPAMKTHAQWDVVVDPSLTTFQDARYGVGAGLGYRGPSGWAVSLSALYLEAPSGSVEWGARPRYPRATNLWSETGGRRLGTMVTVDIPLGGKR